LADQPSCRIIGVRGEIGARVGGDDFASRLCQLLKDDFADHEIASEPGCILDENDLHPVALDAVEKGRQAGSIIEIFRAADARIAELVDDLQPLGLRVLGYGRSLPVPCIPTSLTEAAAAEVADRLGFYFFRLHPKC